MKADPMSDARHDLAANLGREAVTMSAKLSAGPGVLTFGLVTVNDLAVLFGILASVVIIIHTTLKIVWDWRDRNRPKPLGGRTASDE